MILWQPCFEKSVELINTFKLFGVNNIFSLRHIAATFFFLLKVHELFSWNIQAKVSPYVLAVVLFY